MSNSVINRNSKVLQGCIIKKSKLNQNVIIWSHLEHYRLDDIVTQFFKLFYISW